MMQVALKVGLPTFFYVSSKVTQKQTSFFVIIRT